jgi:putative FmdB family regulatory protein
MPLYEYECGACHHRFETIQKFSDAPITECPKCRGALHKLQSAPAFQLKGTGWYATDYPKTGQTPADKDSSGSSDSSSSDTSSSDTSSSDTSSSDKRAAKGDKSEKTGKSDNAEKTGTADKTEKSEKSASAKDSPSSSSTPGSKTSKSEG